jgi:hypothetical protein
MVLFKYVYLFCWSLILLSMVIFITRWHPFIRRKNNGNLNLSEAIYAISLLVSGALVLSPLLQTLGTDFDITGKFYPDKLVVTLVTSGSLITVTGIFVFVLLVFAARGLSTLFFFGRKPLIEFDADNIGYALLRAAVLLSLSLLFTPLCGSLFEYFLPTIAMPFYR